MPGPMGSQLPGCAQVRPGAVGRSQCLGNRLSILSLCVDMCVRVCIGVCTKLSIGMCVLGKCTFMYVVIIFLTAMTKFLARVA